MNEQLAEFFFQEASKSFAFLVTENSFALPQLQIDNKINFAFVTFMGKNVAIECILDEREADVDCKIARVIEGRKTIHYAVDEDGKRVRESLFTLLRRRGIRDRLLSRVTGLNPYDAIPISLRDFARMLSKHGDEVLSDSSTALD